VTSAANTAVTEQPALRDLKPLPPANVKRNDHGLIYGTWVVRLPPQMTIHDLYSDPTLWRVVQGGLSNTLQPLDRVMLIDADQTTAWDAIVAQADDHTVVLSKPIKHELGSRTMGLAFESELYRTEWFQSGWATRRKSDGQMMVGPQSSKAFAIRQHQELYPRKAAT
jgi:hypothetical protein